MADSYSSQKFIGKNNAPRVQIEYDVELYGTNKKVELPFVTGVMSDLSGHRKKDFVSIEERKFLTFDKDNFNDRMRAIKPRLQFFVKNTLNERNELINIELEFESMEDFSPGAIASRIPHMQNLLTARAHLTELITYMDGKSSAEDVVKSLLENPELLHQLVTKVANSDDELEKDNTVLHNKGGEE